MAHVPGAFRRWWNTMFSAAGGVTVTSTDVQALIDAAIAAGPENYKGAIDCSANPNYPAADAGDTYRVSAAGKIGGASGQVVKIGYRLICTTDGTTAGTEASKGQYWDVLPEVATYVAGLIPSTAAGGLSSTSVQAALEELDNEKQAALGFTPENSANKSTDIAADTGSSTKYPNVAAVEAAIALAPGGGTAIALSSARIPDDNDPLGNGVVRIVCFLDAINIAGSNFTAVNKDYFFSGTRDAGTSRKDYREDISNRTLKWYFADSKWKVKNSSGTTTYYESTDDVDNPQDASFTAVGGGATDPITVTLTQKYVAVSHDIILMQGQGLTRIGAGAYVLDADGTYISVDSSGVITFNMFGFQITFQNDGMHINGGLVDFGIDNSGGVGYKVLRVPN